MLLVVAEQDEIAPASSVRRVAALARDAEVAFSTTARTSRSTPVRSSRTRWPGRSRSCGGTSAREGRDGLASQVAHRPGREHQQHDGDVRDGARDQHVAVAERLAQRQSAPARRAPRPASRARRRSRRARASAPRRSPASRTLQPMLKTSTPAPATNAPSTSGTTSGSSPRISNGSPNVAIPSIPASSGRRSWTPHHDHGHHQQSDRLRGQHVAPARNPERLPRQGRGEREPGARVDHVQHPEAGDHHPKPPGCRAKKPHPSRRSRSIPGDDVTERTAAGSRSRVSSRADVSQVVLVNDLKSAGYYTIQFNAANLASGMYFYRIVAEGNGQNFISTKKMVVVK